MDYCLALQIIHLLLQWLRGGVFVIIKVGVKLHDGTPINTCVRIHTLQRCDIKEKNVQKVNFYLTVLEQGGSV